MSRSIFAIVAIHALAILGPSVAIIGAKFRLALDHGDGLDRCAAALADCAFGTGKVPVCPGVASAGPTAFGGDVRIDHPPVAGLGGLAFGAPS